MGRTIDKKGRRITAYRSPPRSPMGGVAVGRLSTSSHAWRHHENAVEALGLLELGSFTTCTMDTSAPFGVSSDSHPLDVENEWIACVTVGRGTRSGLGGCLAALSGIENTLIRCALGRCWLRTCATLGDDSHAPSNQVR